MSQPLSPEFNYANPETCAAVHTAIGDLMADVAVDIPGLGPDYPTRQNIDKFTYSFGHNGVPPSYHYEIRSYLRTDGKYETPQRGKLVSVYATTLGANTIGGIWAQVYATGAEEGKPPSLYTHAKYAERPLPKAPPSTPLGFRLETGRQPLSTMEDFKAALGGLYKLITPGKTVDQAVADYLQAYATPDSILRRLARGSDHE